MTKHVAVLYAVNTIHIYIYTATIKQSYVRQVQYIHCTLVSLLNTSGMTKHVAVPYAVNTIYIPLPSNKVMLDRYSTYTAL